MNVLGNGGVAPASRSWNTREMDLTGEAALHARVARTAAAARDVLVPGDALVLLLDGSYRL